MMKTRLSIRFLAACAAWACAAIPPSTAPGQGVNEQGIWNLWQMQIKNPADHAAVLDACSGFAKANPTDPFAAVAQTIAAWHLLKLDRQEEARSALQSRLQDTSEPVSAGARDLARAWLTLLDMETVRASLQEYYRHEVRYPETLAAITAHPRIPKSLHPPPADRWGRPWKYQPDDFRVLSGSRGQRYRLESASLKGLSSLQAALDLPYAERINIQPVKVIRTGNGRPMVHFRGARAGDTNAVSIVQQGTSAEDIFLAHVGPKLILVCDSLHWRVFPIPR